MDRRGKGRVPPGRHANGHPGTYTPGLNGVHATSSDEEDEAPTAAPPQRASTRRQQPRVDFTKLDTASLKRYRKVYKLGDTPPGMTKEELIPAIARHFAAQTVDESDTLLNFALTLKKQSLQNYNATMTQAPAIKKARNTTKAKPMR